MPVGALLAFVEPAQGHHALAGPVALGHRIQAVRLAGRQVQRTLPARELGHEVAQGIGPVLLEQGRPLSGQLLFDAFIVYRLGRRACVIGHSQREEQDEEGRP